MKSKFRKALSLYQTRGFKALISKGFIKLKEWFSADPDENQIVYKALRRTATTKIMIDVGASTGVTLAPFADAGWLVYAFEPDPGNRAQLHRIFGDYPNVVIDPRAISNAPDKDVPFFSSDVSMGISGLTPFHPSHQETSTVDITTLSEYLSQENIDNVDYLKVDTEGHDLFVLRGFPWSAMKPNVIVCEFDDRKTSHLGYSWKDLASFLERLNYKVLISEWEPIQEYGGSYRWSEVKEFPCELSNSSSWGNIIAVRHERTFRLVVDQF